MAVMAGRINEGYRRTMDYYLALKGKGVLTHATTRVNLEDTLSEITRRRRENPVWFHLREVPGGVRFTETGRGTVAAQSWGRKGGDEECMFNG